MILYKIYFENILRIWYNVYYIAYKEIEGSGIMFLISLKINQSLHLMVFVNKSIK